MSTLICDGCGRTIGEYESYYCTDGCSVLGDRISPHGTVLCWSCHLARPLEPTDVIDEDFDAHATR